MQLKCKKCAYEWNYTGSRKKAGMVVNCPACRNAVRITKEDGGE